MSTEHFRPKVQVPAYKTTKRPKGRQVVLVGEVGLEPTRLIQPTDFKSVAYTNSATRPIYKIIALPLAVLAS